MTHLESGERHSDLAAGLPRSQPGLVDHNPLAPSCSCSSCHRRQLLLLPSCHLLPDHRLPAPSRLLLLHHHLPRLRPHLENILL